MVVAPFGLGARGAAVCAQPVEAAGRAAPAATAARKLRRLRPFEGMSMLTVLLLTWKGF
jgi:hypothetical protein